MAKNRRTFCDARCPHFLKGHRACLDCELVDDTGLRRHRQLDETIPAPDPDDGETPDPLAPARAFASNLLRLSPTLQRVALALVATPRRRNLPATLGLAPSTFKDARRKLEADEYWGPALASVGIVPRGVGHKREAALNRAGGGV